MLRTASEWSTGGSASFSWAMAFPAGAFTVAPLATLSKTITKTAKRMENEINRMIGEKEKDGNFSTAMDFGHLGR